jgi:hypothetical protein
MLRVVAVRPRGPGEHAVQYVTRIDPQSTPHKSTHPRAARVSASPSGTPTPNDTHHIHATRPLAVCKHMSAQTPDRDTAHLTQFSADRAGSALRLGRTRPHKHNTVHGPRSTCEYDDIRWHARAAPWRSLCMRTCNTLTPRHTAHTAGRQRSIGGGECSTRRSFVSTRRDHLGLRASAAHRAGGLASTYGGLSRRPPAPPVSALPLLTCRCRQWPPRTSVNARHDALSLVVVASGLHVRV